MYIFYLIKSIITFPFYWLRYSSKKVKVYINKEYGKIWYSGRARPSPLKRRQWLKLIKYYNKLTESEKYAFKGSFDKHPDII